MAMGQLSYAPRMQDIAFLVVIRSPLAHHYVDFFSFLVKKPSVFLVF